MEVTLKKFEPALFIEELTFWVKPELIEKYIEVDSEVWVPNLCTRKGFVGSEVWVGEEGTGEITMLYFWQHYEDFAGIDKDWQQNLVKRTDEAMGEGNMHFIGAMEKSKKKFKVREYR